MKVPVIPSIFMTIPTAGNRSDLLDALIRQSGLPMSNIIVVATSVNVKVPTGVVVIEDLGPPNIQRWWLRGIQEAESRGAKYVAVLNDDVSVDSESIVKLSRALEQSSAAIASPSRPNVRNGLHRRRLLPYEPRLWGCLWTLRVASNLRPDPRYQWWYGDHDLDIRARAHHGGVVLVPVAFEHHHPGEGTTASEQLQELVTQDTKLFEQQYFWLLKMSRWIRKVKERLGPLQGS